jgi:hypothetical protein
MNLSFGDPMRPFRQRALWTPHLKDVIVFTGAVGGSAVHAMRWLLPVALSGSFGACAIHPLPENVTGVKTAGIVHRIRCEARDAVDQAQRRLIQRLEQVRSARRREIIESRQNILRQIGIVFSFSLQGQEQDNLSTASATFAQPLSNGSFTFNPSVGDSVTRGNIRTFTVIESFSSLLKMSSDRCRSEPTGPNYQYPIVGTIGVAEMIDTFVNLALYTGLGAEQLNIAEGAGSPNVEETAPPAMVDTISFTTTLSAGVNPLWVLNPVGSATQLTGASINVGVQRMDVHQVIIGLALPGPVSSLSEVLVVSSPPQRRLHLNQPQFGLLVSGAPRTDGEIAALDAVNNQILRFQVPKSLIVAP